MHSFHGKSCNIHHNSDMSGEIHIIKLESGEEIKIDAEDILKLVAEHIRHEKIGEIESMHWEEFLK